MLVSDMCVSRNVIPMILRIRIAGDYTSYFVRYHFQRFYLLRG